MVRSTILTILLLALFPVLGACGGSGESTIRTITVRQTRRELGRLPWPVQETQTGSPRVIAARVELGKHLHLRIVIIVQDRNLPLVVCALPRAYQRLVRPNFGSVT